MKAQARGSYGYRGRWCLTVLSFVTAPYCFAEPVSAVLDAKRHATCNYKIDSVFPEGIFVRTGGKTIWLEVPYAQSGLRNTIARNQNTPDRPIVTNSKPEPVPAATPRPANGILAGSVKSGGYTFDSRPSQRAAAPVAQSIRLARPTREINESVRRIPGATSGREMPWEFIWNEAAMWMIWFTTADESVPENAAVNAYIRKQHEQRMLLYRLLIKPWLHKDEE